MENPSERGAQWPRFQWRRFWRGDSVRFRRKKDTPPRKSISPNDDDSDPRFLISRCGNPLRYFSIPNRFEPSFLFSPSTYIDFDCIESGSIRSVKRHLSPERRSGFEGRTAVFDERASARPEAVLISDACSLTRVTEADRSADRVWIIEESRRLSFIWTSVEKQVFRSKLRGHTFVSERSHLIFSRVKLLEDGERERRKRENGRRRFRGV